MSTALLAYDENLVIPQEKIAAATRALHTAFGDGRFEEVKALTARPGSNLAFRIVVGGSAYLLRINTRRGDVTRQFHCMHAAAEAGLAPRVWYTSAEDRISITDFVDAAPFPATDALRRIPAALRRLHALPPFPEASFNTTCTFLLKEGPALDGFLRKFRAGNIVPENELHAILGQLARIVAAYSSLDPDLVPSHNDLFKPDNILFDGTRLWLVDWEAAFQNDRYADLAVVANMLVANESQEQIYLEEYFGAPPVTYQVARFYLMKQLAHVFYAMLFLGLGSASRPVAWSAPVPTYSDFQNRFWAREIDLADDYWKTVYGRIHWEQLRHNVQQPKFPQALRIVANRHAAS